MPHIFTGPVEGWTVNFCQANLWRVQRSMEFDDLMQEAYLVFLKCSNAYPDVVPKHFMSLYMTAWNRRFINLALEATSHKKQVSLSDLEKPTDEGDGISHEMVGELNNDGHLSVLLRQAPKEVLLVLNLFLNAPTELLELALSNWNGGDKRCITGGSTKICKMLGLPEDLDVLQLVKEYFQP